MDLRTRRNFLVEVGRGMITASLGLAAASELGFASICGIDDPPKLLFGSLEPLVDLMIETPADKLNAVIVGKLKSGTSLRDLVTGRGARERADLRRRGLCWVPYDDGARARVPHGARAAHGARSRSRC